MKVREKRRKMEAEQSNSQNIQLTAKANQESGIAVEKAKQATMEMEYSLKKGLEMSLKDKDIEILDKKYAYEIQLKGMDSGVKIDSKHIEADAKVATKHMENEAGKEIAEINASKAKTATA